MVQSIKVKEKQKDDNLGITHKEIKFSKTSLETPNKSFIGDGKNSKYVDFGKLSIIDINEVSKRIDINFINDLNVNGGILVGDTKKRYLNDKLNVLIPHLRINNLAEITDLSGLSNYIYAVSQEAIVLPTIDFSYFKEDRDPKKQNKKISPKFVQQYMDLLKGIMQEINSIGNGKCFIGMIPLIPYTFIKPIFNLYQNLGINAFMIDAGTKDVFGASEFDFRMILSAINKEVIPLNESFIYACNLGYGLFKKDWTTSDDFLSLFTYIDVLGGAFKTRGFSNTGMTYPSRAKVFSRNDYTYEFSSYNEAELKLKIYNLDRVKLRGYNEEQQKIETIDLKQNIGEINMTNYLQQKKAMQEEKIKLAQIEKTYEIVRI